MAWVRIDDHFYRHPKVLQCGPLAMALHVAALCYASDYLTDGLVPGQAVGTLLNLSGLTNEFGEDADPHQLAEWLCNAGLWERTTSLDEHGDYSGDFRIHDYLDYQPSRDHVLREREQLAQLRAEAGRRGAQKRWNIGADGKEDGKPIANAMANESQEDGPVPIPVPRPDPVPKELSNESSQAEGADAPERISRRKVEVTLPDEFDALITEEDITWAQTQGFDGPQILLETERFKTKALAKDWRYRDWHQAWRQWFLTEVKFQRQRAS